MTCPEKQLLSAFADGQLEDSDLITVERHLSACTSCRGFVEEMRQLNTFGRSSLEAIVVTKHLDLGAITARKCRLLRSPVLATAAVLLFLGMGAWYVFQELSKPPEEPAFKEVVATPPNSEPKIHTEGGKPARTDPIRAFSNEAYERWAEPYRQLRIPLVPMEIVGSYKPPEILPIMPETTRRIIKI